MSSSEEIFTEPSPKRKFKQRLDKANKRRKIEKRAKKEDKVIKKILKRPNKKPKTLGDVNKINFNKTAEEDKVAKDSRSLFVRNIPINTTEDYVKSLSSDIINVTFPLANKSPTRSLFAFLEFENEEIAEQNFKRLQGSSLEDNELQIAFCGKKSEFVMKKEQPLSKYNPKRLTVTNLKLNKNMTIAREELKGIFPLSSDILIKRNNGREIAFIDFPNLKFAQDAYEGSKMQILNDKQISVAYSKVIQRNKLA